MDIREATQGYEQWLSDQLQLVPADLEMKHQHMQSSLFQFLRATYYRWAQTWQTTCPDLANAPVVTAVCDLHIENFGTWRDSEGRLVWGINDFDEAFPAPFTVDLLRLATSTLVAIEAEHLTLGRKKACTMILQGYSDALSSGGLPFVLAEQHDWLRMISAAKLRSPVAFWRKLGELPEFDGEVPADAKDAMARLLPDPALPLRFARRVAGLGSLGRQRFVATADWHGGRIAREVKSVALSANVWADSSQATRDVYYRRLLDSSVRVVDPYILISDKWVVRRLAPDCIRVELADLPAHRDESRLLYCMGFETGNIHLASPEMREQIQQDLAARPEDWLLEAAKLMRKDLANDWKLWRRAVN